MARYHPPKNITSNSAPSISADLAYEGHGKCGCQTVILTDNTESGIEEVLFWEAITPSSQPTITGCADYSHVYKIVSLENVKFRNLEATNIAQQSLNALVFGNGGFKLLAGSEIMADFTKVHIISGTLMLYRDCDQS